MRPAFLGLATWALSRGVGQGVQLFEELLDLPFMAGGVLLQLSFRCLHLLPVFVMSGIFIATDKTRIALKVKFLVLLCMCVCVVAGYLY